MRIEIVGDETIAAKYESWAKNRFDVVDGNRFYHTGDCLIQIRNIDGDGFIRFITSGQTGILTYPVSGSRPYEYETGFAFLDGVNHELSESGEYKEITADIKFSKVGGGTYSYLFSFDDEWECVNGEYLYGNTSWVGDDGLTLSWIMSPSSGLPQNKAAFPPSSSIYSEGMEMVAAPGIVLGAAYDSFGRLAVVFNNDGNTVVSYQSGTEWIELLRISISLTFPCIMESDKFKFADGSYFEVFENRCVYVGTTNTSTNGEHKESGSIHILESASRSWNGFEITSHNECNTVSDSTSSSTDITVPVYLSGPYAASIVIRWNGSAVNASVSGGIYCDISWSVPGGVTYHFDDNDPHHMNLIIDSLSGCINGDIQASTFGIESNKLHVQQNITWVTDGFAVSVTRSEIPPEIVQYVSCNEYQCYGASYPPGAPYAGLTTYDYYQSWPAWICPSAGPIICTTLVTKQRYVAVCP